MLPVMRSMFVVLAACCPPSTAPVMPVVAPPPVPISVDAAPARLPVARTVDVIDHDFGLAVADPYRWMEGERNAEVTAWLREQGDHAAAQLAKLPARDQLH